MLTHEEFTSPFGDVCSDIINGGSSLYTELSKNMREDWGSRPLSIGIVDKADFNAEASPINETYCISIHRGAIEQLYGAFYGLLSCPTFLPAIGKAGDEEYPKELIGTAFPPIPIMKSATSLPDKVPFPNDQARGTFACLLADFALHFLVYHEIGHVVAGHLEIPRALGSHSSLLEYDRGTSGDDETTLSRVLECDADAFACHVLDHVELNAARGSSLEDIVKCSDWNSDQLAYIAYFVAIAVLFRCNYPHAPVKIGEEKKSHPHPAVRACVVNVCAGARSQQNGRINNSGVTELFQASVGNVEEVWAELCLPRQNSESPSAWAMSVRTGMNSLLADHAAHSETLDRYAHIDRRWHDWELPSSGKSA